MICKVCKERYTCKSDKNLPEKAKNWLSDEKGFCSMQCELSKEAEQIRREELYIGKIT